MLANKSQTILNNPMLNRLVIEKLFGVFDYDIELSPKNLTVLVGPNGYGKTTILNIINELSNKNFLYFINLPFNSIKAYFDDSEPIEIQKKGEFDIFYSVGTNTDPYYININDILELLAKKLPVERKSEDTWYDFRADCIITTKELVAFFNDDVKHIISRADKKMGLFNQSFRFDFPKAHLIKEQRLLKKIQNEDEFDERRLFRRRSKPVYEEIIEVYANSLKDVMDQADSKYAEKSRELDSSYPRRLFESHEAISADEFQVRFEKIKETQRLLSKYGLSGAKEELSPAFDSDNAKALRVYLDDVEEKLIVFKHLLNSLNLFLEILDSRKFVQKQVNISKEYGLKFIAQNKTQLHLSDLSSGEQHEVVLFFDLLFQEGSNSLMLIDEPEISLNIAWQKEFLSDLSKIIELRGITIIVATHSPQIINGQWEYVYDLGEALS